MWWRTYPALAISLAFHAAILAVLGVWQLASDAHDPEVVLESVFAEEREQEQFAQDVDIDTTTSEQLSLTAGGVVNENLGASANTPIAQAQVEQSQAVEDPQVRVPNIGDIDVPGLAELGEDLGEGAVSGEVGARVEGYGAAMHRLTQEIIRMMREQPVIAVWLFDASHSLKDDREEIRDNFNKVYEELDVAREQASLRGERYAPLETMVCSFGENVKKLLPAPTDELQQIRGAIDRVADDESGVENVFQAISNVIDEYAVTAGRSRRKLIVITLTDESGDDVEQLEDVLSKAQQYSTPCYFLGREAVFGYPYAHERWTDPETGLTWPVRITRGPETAFPECLQYDGFHGRWDSASSGFGPYEQVRLAKHSGGIFFLLGREEENLGGHASRLQRKFDDIAMKEYEPLLLSRREYARRRDASEFRSTIWDVIVRLNPHLDEDLRLFAVRDVVGGDLFPLDILEFNQAAEEVFNRTLRAMRILDQAGQRLEQIRPLRDLEQEQRWRAAYDLIYAQCLAYRVRQFQLLLALDRHSRQNPKPADPKSNRWEVRRVPQMVEPTEEQVQATKVDMEELERQRQRALELYRFVVEEHPQTPWAQRAQQEMRWGFGIAFVDTFRDPRYDDPQVRPQIPNF